MNYFNFKELVGATSNTTLLKVLIKFPDFFNFPYSDSPQRDSKEIDKILGFKISKVEQKLLTKYRAYWKLKDDSNKKKHFEGTETWIGLNPQVLQTPYSEIIHFLSKFSKFKPKKIVDLGAGYGRIGIVMNSIFPECSFIGYEIVDARLNEAKRMFEKLDLKNCKMINQNILSSEFEMPKADIYFIYDFSAIEDLKHILRKLSDKIYNDRFFIVAKGDFVRSLIQMSYPEFWVSHGAIHRQAWSLYSSFCDI